MLKTQERVFLPYRPAVVARLVLSALSGSQPEDLQPDLMGLLISFFSIALLSTVTIALASIRKDEGLPFEVSRGWTFYLQMLVILVEILLTVASTYDFMISRRLGGDPTFYSRDPSGSGALTYSNPSFKDDSGRSGVGGGRPGSSNGSSTSTINSTISGSSVRSTPNGKQSSSNGSRLHNSHNKTSSSGKSPSGRSPSGRSPSGRTSPHRIRPSKRPRKSNRPRCPYSTISC